MTSPRAKTSKPKSSTRRGKSVTPEALVPLLKQAQEALQKNPQMTVVTALRAQGLTSPLILAGTQHVRAKRTIAWIKEQFFGQTASNVSAYFGTELTSAGSISHIVNSLGTRSLFSKDSLLVIYESDKIKAAVADALDQAIRKDEDTTLVVVTADSADKAGSLAAKLADSGTVVDLKELAESTLRRWLEKEAKRSGASGMESGAVEMLMRNYGGDTTALAHEIEKMALLTEPGQFITERLVQQMCLRSPEVTSFQLIGLMANRNAVGSSALAKDLVDQGMHPIQICHFLSRVFRMLGANKHPGDAALHSDLSNAWFLNQVRGALRSFSEPDLRESIEVIKRLDFQLKDSGLPDALALGLAVQKIALRQFEGANSRARRLSA